MREEIFEKEKQFHDQWASTIDVEGIRVRDTLKPVLRQKIGLS
jgi:hypothetical protein